MTEPRPIPLGDRTIYTLRLKTDVDRYNSIATRWPSEIVITGTVAQLNHFLEDAMYEAGCTELLIPADAESEALMERMGEC